MPDIEQLLVAYDGTPLAEKALELGGPRPQILDTLGWAHCLSGNHQEAVKYLERARDGLPQLPDIRYHLGVAYRRAGQTDRAAAELRQALNISSTFSHAQEARRLLNSLQSPQ